MREKKAKITSRWKLPILMLNHSFVQFHTFCGMAKERLNTRELDFKEEEGATLKKERGTF